MERLTYEAQTPAFGIAIKQVELYQDPTNPAQRTITATLELTHAVEPGELDRHLQFGTVSGSNLFTSNDPAPHFKITWIASAGRICAELADQAAGAGRFCEV